MTSGPAQSGQGGNGGTEADTGHTVFRSGNPKVLPGQAPVLTQSPAAISEQLDQLVKMASDYAGQALQSLVQQAEGDDNKLRELFYQHLDLAIRLEVHFLFPNLDDNERLLLVSLSSSRRALVVGRKNMAQQQDPEERSQRHSALEAVQQRYILVRSEVMSRGMARRMTPLQQQLLQREFMQLPKPEPDAASPVL